MSIGFPPIFCFFSLLLLLLLLFSAQKKKESSQLKSTKVKQKQANEEQKKFSKLKDPKSQTPFNSIKFKFTIIPMSCCNIGRYKGTYIKRKGRLN